MMVKRMSIEIQGYCDPRFENVRELLAASIESGADLGASFAATVDGEMVVDLWGGHQDEAQQIPWQENTITNVYSTTKTMSFLCALLLADRGELDFDAPVAQYWPEFAQNGKEEVKVWHVMNHAAGLSGLEVRVSETQLYDWDKITDLLAAQKPWWTPGSVTGYHAITQGFLIGEIVRRITGQSIGEFFQTEIARPLQADFFIGVPLSEFPRISDLVPPNSKGRLELAGDADSIRVKTFRSPATNALASRTEGWRRAEIPAANGHGNARSVAKIHAILACGGEANGVRLMSPETAASVMRPRISGEDLVLNVPMSFGLGFGIIKPQVCSWGGWGGSLVIIDQAARSSIAYVMNKMHPGLMGDTRSGTLATAFYRSLKG